MAHSPALCTVICKSDPHATDFSARMRSLQENQMIFETALSLSLIGVVGAIVRVVEWHRYALRGPYIRRDRRNG